MRRSGTLKRRTIGHLYLPLCLILVSLPAYSAGPYRFELHGGLSRMDTSLSFVSRSGAPAVVSTLGAGNLSTDVLDFSGDYYFGAIETGNGPLQEAAFLAKASALTLSVSDSRAKQYTGTGVVVAPNIPGVTYMTDLKERDYDLRYQFVASTKPWIGVVSYNYSLPEDMVQLRRTSYSVGMGRYIGRRTSLVAEYGRSDFQVFPSLQVKTLTMRARSLLPLGMQRYLAVSAVLSRNSGPIDLEPLRTYEVGVTYYPRDDVSIGLSTTNYYENYSVGYEHAHHYLLQANWFVTKSIALGMDYEKYDDRASFGYPSLGPLSLSHVASDGFRFNISWRH